LELTELRGLADWGAVTAKRALALADRVRTQEASSQDVEQFVEENHKALEYFEARKVALANLSRRMRRQSDSEHEG